MKNLMYAIEKLGGITNAVQWAALGSAPLNVPQAVQLIPNLTDDGHLGVGINTSSGATVVYLAVEGSVEDDPALYGIQKYETTSTNVLTDLQTLLSLVDGLSGRYLAENGMVVVNQPAADLTTCQFKTAISGFTVTFTDGSFPGPGVGSIVSYVWDFGDNTATSTVQNPSHTYSTSGTYAVSLTVTDSNGESAEAWLGVTVPAAV